MVATTRSTRSSLRTCAPLLPSSSSSSSSSSVKQERWLHEELASIKTVVKDEPPSVTQDTGLHHERDSIKTSVKDEEAEAAEAEDGEEKRIHGKLRDDDLGEEDDRKAYISSPALASSYEAVRLQRIAENQARMAALGVRKYAADLTSYFSAAKPGRRPWRKSPIPPLELRRRSERLKNILPASGFYTPSFSHRSDDDIDKIPKLQLVTRSKVSRNYLNGTPLRPANAPIPKYIPADLKITPTISALRCRSKGRGSLYDAVVGICCHFCRQKKLCGEQDCERCGKRDVTKACLGKTDCSRCHSSTGVFCRACLKVRYGEEMEEVRQKKDWICPHCSEAEGLNPYWICNSSICLARRKVAPTGIAIYKARQMGYKSVAHYIADILRKQGNNS